MRCPGWLVAPPLLVSEAHYLSAVRLSCFFLIRRTCGAAVPHPTELREMHRELPELCRHCCLLTQGAYAKHVDDHTSVSKPVAVNSGQHVSDKQYCSSLACALVLTNASTSSHLRHLVTDITELLGHVIESIERWATTDSSAEAAVCILKTMRQKLSLKGFFH